MRGLRYIAIMIGAGLFCVVGCGDQQPPAPPPTQPRDTTQTNKIPDHGIVYLAASRTALRLAKQVDFDPLTEAHAALTARDDAATLEIQAGADFDEPDRLRYWLLPREALSDEEADLRAAVIWEELAAEVDAKFRAALDARLKWLDLELAEARDTTGQAQEALRSYRATRRGLDATPESRREEARLTYELDKALEAQDAIAVQAQDIRSAIESAPTALRRTN